MAKVHPNSVVVPVPSEPAATATPPPPAAGEHQVLTVWRKSLLFNCDGFTVFDAKGDLAFRVDCYDGGSRRRRAEVVLMDVAGTPLLTVRRKRLVSLTEHWVIYDGDATAGNEKRPLLSVRRHASLHHHRSSGKALAHVTPLASGVDSGVVAAGAYVVEGSYGRRACAVRDANGDAVAEVCQKESLSVDGDVFRLVADPRLGAPLAMGLVIALDKMFSPSSSGSAARSLLRRTWSV